MFGTSTAKILNCLAEYEAANAGVVLLLQTEKPTREVKKDQYINITWKIRMLCIYSM